MTHYDWRRTKRVERKIGLQRPTYVAYMLGQQAGASKNRPDATRERWQRNPYPPGRRHDEWNRGYNEPERLF